MSLNDTGNNKPKGKGALSLLEARLEQAVRLKKFFARLLEEVMYLHADSIKFRDTGGQLHASVCRNGSEIKSISLKKSWYQPIVSWLSYRACRYSDDSESVDFETPADLEGVICSIRLQDRVITALVQEDISADGGKSLNLSNLSEVPLIRCIEQLDIQEKNSTLFQRLIDSGEGLILVGSPNEEDLRRSTCITLSLTNACYAGDLDDLDNVRPISKLVSEKPILVRAKCNNVVELLFKAKRAGFNLDRTVLAGAIFQSFARRSCLACRKEELMTDQQIQLLPARIRPEGRTTYLTSQGCSACDESGVKGVIAIQSLLVFNSGARGKVGQKSVPEQVAKIAYELGTRPLLIDGVRKALQGLASFKEVFSVVDKVPKTFEKLICRKDLGHTEHSAAIVTDIDFFTEIPVSAYEEEDDKGAIPLEVEEPPGGDSQLFSVSPAGKVRDKPLLMIVEDDEDQRNILEMVLRMADYDIVMSENGVEALELLKEDIPDLIISDLMMPQMDGSELVKNLKENKLYQNIPILILTVVNDGDKEYMLLNLGADDYCEKTIQRKILLQRVENLLKRSSKKN